MPAFRTDKLDTVHTSGQSLDFYDVNRLTCHTLVSKRKGMKITVQEDLQSTAWYSMQDPHHHLDKRTIPSENEET
jgi:hypothetical protein